LPTRARVICREPTDATKLEIGYAEYAVACTGSVSVTTWSSTGVAIETTTPPGRADAERCVLLVESRRVRRIRLADLDGCGGERDGHDREDRRGYDRLRRCVLSGVVATATTAARGEDGAQRYGLASCSSERHHQRPSASRSYSISRRSPAKGTKSRHPPLRRVALASSLKALFTARPPRPNPPIVRWRDRGSVCMVERTVSGESK
jgi:hypothetical protein